MLIIIVLYLIHSLSFAWIFGLPASHSMSQVMSA